MNQLLTMWKVWRLNAHQERGRWRVDHASGITDVGFTEEPDADQVITKLRQLRILRPQDQCEYEPEIEAYGDRMFVNDFETGEPLLELHRYNL